MNRRPCCAGISIVALIALAGFYGQARQSASTETAGGRGGKAFADAAPPDEARILEVHIWTGDFVDSIQMISVLPDGRTAMNQRHGGKGGRLQTFRLDPGEYITGISGRYGDYVDSIRIHTNRRTSSLFGGRGGDREFRIEVPAGNQAVGFAGRAKNYLDAIGLIYAPIRRLQISQTTIAGGRGGAAFLDREIPAGARIGEIRVRAGDLVDSIQAVYVLPDGRLLQGARHGGGGGRTEIFRLDADEYVIALSGRCGDYVDSLRIHTNKRTSQLFGGRGGDRDFRIEVPRGNQGIGFAGRSGEYLDAVGLAYAPLQSNPSRIWRRRP